MALYRCLSRVVLCHNLCPSWLRMEVLNRLIHLDFRRILFPFLVKEKIKVDKSDLGVAKKVISKILNDKSIKNLEQLKKILCITLGQKDDKKDGEISEFVDATGAFK